MKAPFKYFGGKSRAAPMIWDALGDPGGYVEPFAGSAAVLLARPEFAGRRVETINDADGWLVNMWRAVKYSPDEVVKFADGPVMEIDYHARLAWLHERRSEGLVAWLEGDPENHDPKAAGWWLYVMANGIGDPFGGGPWRVVDGKLVRLDGDGVNGVIRQIPQLSTPGSGVLRSTFDETGPRTLEGYMRRLSARLSRVRVTCGSWERVLTPAVIRTKSGGDGSVGILLDPPYATSGDLYAHGDSDGSISGQVREWCKTAPESFRIVLCGYEGEHSELESLGWSCVEGKAGGKGYANDPLANRRERLWMSPSCLSTLQESWVFD